MAGAPAPSDGGDGGPTYVGSGGGGGAGFIPGNGGEGVSAGLPGVYLFGGAGGGTGARSGGAGGNLGFAGSAGTAGTLAGGSGGLAGSTGSTGTAGARGAAILGANNLTFINTGTIDGSQSNSFDFAPVVEGVSLVTTVQSTTQSLVIPSTSDIAAGDFGIFFDGSYNNSATGYVTPTDWTFIGGTPSTNLLRSIVSYKVLTNADIGATVTGMAGVYKSHKLLAIFRPSFKPLNNLLFSVPVTQYTTATPTAQSIAMNGLQTPVLGFAFHFHTSTIASTMSGTGATFTSNLFTLATSTSIRYARFNKNETPTNASVTANDGGTNTFISFNLRIN